VGEIAGVGVAVGREVAAGSDGSAGRGVWVEVGEGVCDAGIIVVGSEVPVVWEAQLLRRMAMIIRTRYKGLVFMFEFRFYYEWV